MAKSKPSESQKLVGRGKLLVSVNPRNASQQLVVDLWPRSRILFLIGPAGGGKTHIALALALYDLLSRPATDQAKLMLARPMIAVDEEIGYLPGTVEEKTTPWLGPYKDVLGQITFEKWDTLCGELNVEAVPVGMLQGRTIRNGTLLIDEAQALTPAQIKCALTRIGDGGRLIFCGDPDQSLYYTSKNSPLLAAARKLDDLDTVATVHFKLADQVRDPLVSEILARL